MAWYVAMVFISSKVYLMVFFRILNFASMDFIEDICVVALAIVVITISGSTSHSLLVIFSINGHIFPIL